MVEHKMNNDDDCTEIVTLEKKRDDLLKVTNYIEHSDLKANIKEHIFDPSCKKQSAYKDVLTSLSSLMYTNSDKGLNSCFNKQLTDDKNNYSETELIQIKKTALNLEIAQLEWAQDIKENIPFKVTCESERDNAEASFRTKKITGKYDTINLSTEFLSKMNSEKNKFKLAEILNANIGHEVLHFAGIADSLEGHQLTNKIIASCYNPNQKSSRLSANAPTEALANAKPDLNIAKPDANLPINNKMSLQSAPNLNVPEPDSNAPNLNPLNGNSGNNINVAANNTPDANVNFSPEARAATVANEYPVTGLPQSFDATEVTSSLPAIADLNSGFNQLLPSITPSPESVEDRYNKQSAPMMAKANNLIKTFVNPANAQTTDPNIFVPKTVTTATSTGANAIAGTAIPGSSNSAAARLPANQATNSNAKLAANSAVTSKNNPSSAKVKSNNALAGAGADEPSTTGLQSGDNNKSPSSTNNQGQSASSLSIGSNVKTQNELVAALQKNEKNLDKYLRDNPDIEKQLQKYELLLVVPNANKYDLKPGYGDTKSKSRIIYDPFTKRITVSSALKKPPK